jgi:hypothetical protein
MLTLLHTFGIFVVICSSCAAGLKRESISPSSLEGRVAPGAASTSITQERSNIHAVDDPSIAEFD